MLLVTVTVHYNGKLNAPKPITNEIPEKYVLITENDIVRLYYGEKLIKEYPNIVPSALPLMDQDNLKSGIIFENYTEVSKIIEDFDG